MPYINKKAANKLFFDGVKPSVYHWNGKTFAGYGYFSLFLYAPSFEFPLDYNSETKEIKPWVFLDTPIIAEHKVGDDVRHTFHGTVEELFDNPFPFKFFFEKNKVNNIVNSQEVYTFVDDETNSTIKIKKKC